MPRAAVDVRKRPVGIVGAGRVGSVLGAALARAGHPVVAVSALSDASRARAAALLPGVPVHADAAEVAGACSLLLLAVPDDALGGLVAGLADTGALAAGQLVAHTSGRHGLGVLDPAVRRGAAGLALHPAMTFGGDGAADLARLTGTRFGVTAPSELRGLAAGLVAELGGTCVEVSEAARPLYHAALAHGANGLVTLVAQAVDALRAAGADDPSGLLRPLLAAALDNALDRGSAAATGPVVRGDARTVAAHLRVLAEDQPETVATYAALARATAARALGDGRLRRHEAAAVLDALATPTVDPAPTGSAVRVAP